MNENLNHLLELQRTSAYAFRRINNDAIRVVIDSFPILRTDRDNISLIAYQEQGLCVKRAIEYRGIRVAEWEVSYNGEEVYISNMHFLADNSELELARQLAESDSWQDIFSQS